MRGETRGESSEEVSSTEIKNVTAPSRSINLIIEKFDSTQRFEPAIRGTMARIYACIKITSMSYYVAKHIDVMVKRVSSSFSVIYPLSRLLKLTETEILNTERYFTDFALSYANINVH